MITNFKIFENISLKNAPKGMDVELFLQLKNKFKNSIYEIIFDRFDENETYININDTSLPDINDRGRSNTLIDFVAKYFNKLELEKEIEKSIKFIKSGKDTRKTYGNFITFLRPELNFDMYYAINNYNI